jgi:AcrR family transcriptional regulator
MRVTVRDEANQAAPRGRGGRPRIPGLTDRILSATIELAADTGIEDLTLDAIAARAEVGRPTIYRRWASKEALLSDAVDKMLEAYFRPPKPGHIRDQLIEFAQRTIDHMERPLRSMWLAYFNMEQAHFSSSAMERAASLPQDIIRRAIDRGELRSDTDPHTVMELIFAPIWYRSTIGRPFEPTFAEKVVDGVLGSWLVP